MKGIGSQIILTPIPFHLFTRTTSGSVDTCLISTTSYLFPVLSWCHADLLSKMIAESSGITEATGISNLCHVIILCL